MSSEFQTLRQQSTLKVLTGSVCTKLPILEMKRAGPHVLQAQAHAFSLENCFLMDQTRLLIYMDGVTHEVDSIVECRGP